MLLLDTSVLPARDRVEAFREALVSGSTGNRVVHEEPPEGLYGRMEGTRVGGLAVFTSHNTGFRLVRTGHHVRQDDRALIGLAIQTLGEGRLEVGDDQQAVGAGDLLLNDLTRPHGYSWSGVGAAKTIIFTHDQLGLPVDTVRAATFRLRASPLHDLVHRHLATLHTDADRLAFDPGAPALANATLELIRALFVSAAGNPAVSRPVLADTLLTRVLAYAREHLDSPDLNPGHLARVHHVSVRRLHQVFERAGISLEQWIITQRLEGARAALTSPANAHLTIATVAHHWGFTQPTHFSRRFREAYGTTPREWRQRHR
ncbi:helix-turn-helix domain-containing protein [Saccharothrix xinjiangensis]|uniref:Helix-turn-helix domain-containing protein n=1 Tax=Saccharothrix xinjiangensis TaxID=204798 RepID=A0ABV9Y1P6_9PSEU